MGAGDGIERRRSGGPSVKEVQCRTALNQVKGMKFRWSLNPYRGCQHACAYCYARTTHAFLGLDVGEDFSTQLFAKTNVAQVLRSELRRRSWQREMVAIGTSTDPYQPVEGRYQLTRACLIALADFSTPANVTTKGTLVVRDVDVLQTLHERAGAGVSLSMITVNEDVWRKLEPGTAAPRQRLRALRLLRDAGVPCGVALAPVLPGLTDSRAAMEALVGSVADAGASWLWAGAIHLEPAVRDYFLECLQRHFPQAIGPYVKVFGAPGGAARARYSPSGYEEAVQRRVAELKARYGLEEWRRPAPSAEGANLPVAETGQAPAAAPLSRPSDARQLALPI